MIDAAHGFHQQPRFQAGQSAGIQPLLESHDCFFKPIKRRLW